MSDDCAPGTAGSSNRVSARVVLASETVISCADDAPFVITPAEQAAITARVAEFNQAIQARASANGWIFIDVPAIQQERLTDASGIRLCQGLLSATSQAQRIEVMQATCPLPRDDPRDFFGTLFSFDGLHPSREGQQVIADRMEAAVRAKHGI